MTGITGPIVATQTTNTVGAATIALPYPASMTSSHIMVMYASVNSTTQPTLPAGWTQVFRVSAAANTAAPSFLVAIKQATGSESGNLSVTLPSAKATGQIIAFGGVNLTTPQDAAATSADKAAGSPNMVLTGVTTTRTGVALVYVGGLSIGADQVTTAPATYTQDGDGIGTGGWPGTMGHKIWSLSGATGTVTIVWNANDKGIGFLLALRALDELGTGNLTVTAALTAAGDLTRAATADLTVTATMTATATVTRAGSGDQTVTATLAADSLLNRGATGTLAETVTLAADAAKSAATSGTEGIFVTRAATADLTRGASGDLAISLTGIRLVAAAQLTRGAAGDEPVTVGLAAAGAVIRGASGTEAIAVTLTADADVIAGGNPKVYIGGAWTRKPLKVYIGGSWVHKPIKSWNGSAWVSH